MDKEHSEIVRPGLWVDPKKLPNIKKKLREKIPPINIIPNYKKIIAHLNREGYKNSAKYMENLVKLENDIVNEKLVKQSLLKSGFNIIEKLIETLKAMENNPNKIDHMYELLKFVCEINQIPEKDYRWIIEQIFLLIIIYSKNYSDDEEFKKLETKANYFYSQFLIKNDLHENALKCLLEANIKCEGKFWVIDTNAKVVKLLYNEINNLISICCIKLSKDYNNVNLLLEQKYAEDALEYANISLNEETVAEANLLNAKVLLGKNRVVEALALLNTSIMYAERVSNQRILCECYKSLGQIYYDRGKVNRAEEYIQQVISIAQKDDNLQIYNGESLALLAEWNLLKKNFDKAACYYNEALQKFIATGRENLILQTRLLFGTMFYIKLESIYFELIKSISYSKYYHHHHHHHLYYDQMQYEYDKNEEEQDTEIRDENKSMEYNKFSKNLLDKMLLWRDKHIPFWDHPHRHHYSLNDINFKVSKSIIDLHEENEEVSALDNKHEEGYYQYSYQSIEKLVEIIKSNKFE